MFDPTTYRESGLIAAGQSEAFGGAAMLEAALAAEAQRAAELGVTVEALQEFMRRPPGPEKQAAEQRMVVVELNGDVLLKAIGEEIINGDTSRRG